MSSFRKKSSSSTDESSSTSFSGSSSSSGSSSGSDSGSSSSDTETSSTVEEKRQTLSKTNSDAMLKSQVITRRKSSEVKTCSKAVEVEKKSAAATTKLRSTNVAQRLSRSNDFSSEDDTPPNKKPTRLLNSSSVGQRKKSVTNSSAQQQSPLSTGGGKAPPAVVKQHHQQNFSAKSATKINAQKDITPPKVEEAPNKHNNVSSVASSENSDAELSGIKKPERKLITKPIAVNKQPITTKVKTVPSRTLPKRNFASKTHPRAKSSEESESESGSTSGDGSSSSTDSDASESSNSSASQTLKKPKRSLEPTTEGLDTKQGNKDRKLTRSLSTRRSKPFLSRSGGAVSETESDMEAEMGKYNFSKSPTKKVPTGLALTKTNAKKEGTSDKPRSQSPPFNMEKKCPIEGCDSSGHLSGNQDKHFLAEACPIFHNMSASECKERANERVQREEFRQKSSSQHDASRKSLSTEQKEFLAKIRESRTRFRPIPGNLSTDKIKVEKDCQDDDREPSLSGLVPDYDLQLFREAQAIASGKIEEELSDLPVGKGIKYITMGKYKMKVWYQSPYPDDAARLPKMYICEFCLRYQKSETGIKRHAQKCVWRHPPGDEIYRKGKLQVWQVDGKRHKQYCQHLCLLAKFFLDHKTLYYDVEPFLFYIMTLADVDGCHTVGYFSKEKNSFYNVSCILTLPPYQRKGYGRLLIDFSYLLTRVEGKIGSPEKPLSDLGLISYRSYWKDVLLDYLCNRTGSTLSIKDVSQEMAIYSYDIVSTLQALGMMKYWKGKHIVLKKQDVLDEYEERVKRRGNFPKIDDSCLRWSPFVPPQANPST